LDLYTFISAGGELPDITRNSHSDFLEKTLTENLGKTPLTF